MIRPEGFPPLPGNWTSETTGVPSPSGDVKLSVTRLKKEGSRTNRILFVIHGQGEHGGRYEHAAHYLDSTLDEIFLPDLRGHGKSEGGRGHVERFDEYVEDTAHLLEKLHRENPTKSIHLLGHSMGGLIALRLIRFHQNLPLKSVTLSAPLLRLKMKVPVWKHFGAFLMEKIHASLPIASALDAEGISSDPKVQEAYINDRLNHSVATPRFYFELLRVTDETRAWNERVPEPVMIQIPMADSIVDSQATLLFAKNWITKPKKTVLYEDFRHESYNEIGKEKAWNDLSQWILNPA